MPAMQFPNILAFVEGTMERLFLNNNFQYVNVVSMSNGSGWTVDAICNQIATKYKVNRANPDFVIVWLDMEKQNCSPDVFRQSIRAKLREIGVPEDKIAICIPDRMTENIILADENVICAEFGIQFVYDHEGQNGKAVLKSLYSAAGKSYRETFHGVTLLKKIRLRRSAAKNKSANDFLSEFSLPCWWI